MTRSFIGGGAPVAAPPCVDCIGHADAAGAVEHFTQAARESAKMVRIAPDPALCGFGSCLSDATVLVTGIGAALTVCAVHAEPEFISAIGAERATAREIITTPKCACGQLGTWLVEWGGGRSGSGVAVCRDCKSEEALMRLSLAKHVAVRPPITTCASVGCSRTATFLIQSETLPGMLVCEDHSAAEFLVPPAEVEA